MTHEATARPRLHVCAIGASAGGVSALKEFFRLVPDNLGLAYVVIIHLSPDHPSQMSEILSGATKMPVQQVSDSPRLEPNHVYVIAPDRELVIEGNAVTSRPVTDPRSKRAPIDLFFRSVAAGRGDGLAVVLSGAGSDGAVGIRSIKEAGGIVFVQDPKDAEFPMMPRSAIAAGAADFIAPIPQLVKRITEVVHSKNAVHMVPEETAEQVLQRIIAFLRARTGHDFSSYKRATVRRRVARRMQVTRNDSLAGYYEYLAANPEEAHELFGDLLISVTSFFRDPPAYDALVKDVIEPMFDEAEDDGVRAWVAGCATGEEAYSLAIVMLEEAARRGMLVPIQIFATDLDEGALATAREGRYPTSIEADVSEERLKKFFVREGVHYRVKKEVRDVVLFATHSVLKDTPFMRLDMISCRNLLIYLEKELQREVCALFAYALKPHGALFLGSAETTDALPDLFSPLSREARIYRARPQAVRKLPTISHYSGDHRPPLQEKPRRPSSEEHDRSIGVVHAQALEHAAPPSMLVDRDYHVLNLSDTVGRFLLPSGGPLSSDIGALVRPELRLDLRTAIRRTIDKAETTLTPPIPVAFNGSSHRVTLYVAPAAERDDDRVGQALVVFLDGGKIDPAPDAGGEGSSDEAKRLREELSVAEARLAASKSENEAAIQDLRVANEELQSINEEYRSTSEELETSKEELQSMNEELQTVNAELKNKLETIGAAHSDLENIVAATDIGTLFLDPKLRIRMFTPRVAQIFNVAEGDIGRAITDFTHRLKYEALPGDIARVLQDLALIEREVETIEQRWLMMRIRPYRTIDDRIDGVVVTFVDITARREALARMRASDERFRALVNSTSDTIFRMSADWSQLLEVKGRGFVADATRATDNWLDIYILEEDQPMIREAARDAFRRKGTFELQHRLRRADGTIGWAQSRAVPILNDDGQIVEWFGSVTDETARRQYEEDLRNARDALALATAASQLGWGTWDFATDSAIWDQRGRDIIGLSETEVTINDWFAHVHEDDRDTLRSEIEASVTEGRAFDLEYRVRGKDQVVRVIHGTGTCIRDGQQIRGTGLVRDVTELRQWEENQRDLIGELNHRVKNMLAVVISIARQTQRSTSDIDSFMETFMARIMALARVHSLLTRREWRGADLGELIGAEMEAFATHSEDCIHIDGPHVHLKPNATLSLVMAFHELGTNAVKHGSLSVPAGKVDISWKVEAEGKVVIDWVEHGGPQVNPPTSTGFGTRLLEGGVARELNGAVSLDYNPKGLCCRIEFTPEKADEGPRPRPADHRG